MSERLVVPETLRISFDEICDEYGLTIETREELLEDLMLNGPEELDKDSLDNKSDEELLQIFCDIY